IPRSVPWPEAARVVDLERADRIQDRQERGQDRAQRGFVDRFEIKAGAPFRDRIEATGRVADLEDRRHRQGRRMTTRNTLVLAEVLVDGAEARDEPPPVTIEREGARPLTAVE